MYLDLSENGTPQNPMVFPYYCSPHTAALWVYLLLRHIHVDTQIVCDAPYTKVVDQS